MSNVRFNRLLTVPQSWRDFAAWSAEDRIQSNLLFFLSIDERCISVDIEPILILKEGLNVTHFFCATSYMKSYVQFRIKKKLQKNCEQDCSIKVAVLYKLFITLEVQRFFLNFQSLHWKWKTASSLIINLTIFLLVFICFVAHMN